MILLISPRYGTRADTVKLIEAARVRGIKTQTLLNNWNIDTLAPNEQCAVYGEQAFCEFVAQELRLNFYQNSLDWIARLPHAFVKRSIRYMRMREAIEIEENNHTILGRRLLEPADDIMDFDAGFYTKNFPFVPHNTNILVHSYHEWVAKFRFVVVNGKPVASCCYRLCDTFNLPAIWQVQYDTGGIDAKSFLDTLLDHVNCAPSCVIDVGYIKQTGWAVVSTLPIWSAELYGCSPNNFLDALFAANQRME